MVKITINEKQIEVPEGTTVLRAAETAGIYIPRLCDHKELTPYGGCRLCIVEVEGARVPMASCTLPQIMGWWFAPRLNRSKSPANLSSPCSLANAITSAPSARSAVAIVNCKTPPTMKK